MKTFLNFKLFLEESNVKKTKQDDKQLKVLFIFYKCPKLHAPTNFYMITITLFNLIGTIIVFPFQIISNLNCRWVNFRILHRQAITVSLANPKKSGKSLFNFYILIWNRNNNPGLFYSERFLEFTSLFTIIHFFCFVYPK